jgi:hypothetical protein
MNDESAPDRKDTESRWQAVDSGAAPRDEALLAMFQARDGSPLRAVLCNGNVLTVFNIAWGYDLGDEYAHVTSNVSPPVEGSAVDLFFTSDVDHVLDPATGGVVFTWP